MGRIYRLTYRDEEINLHEFETVTIDYCKKIYEKGRSSVIAGPFGYLIVPLAIELVLHDYTVNIPTKKDPKKRPSMLLIARSSVIRKFLEKTYIYVEDVMKLSIRKINLLIDEYKKGLDLNMDDPYNCHLYWSYYIKKRYIRERIPQKLPVHYFFPAGYVRKDGNVSIIGSRDYFGRYDGQSPVFYLSSSPDVVNRCPKCDYILCDYSHIRESDPVVGDGSIPIIHIFDNITDYRIPKVRNGDAEVFLWSSGMIRAHENKCDICDGGKNSPFSSGIYEIRNMKKRRMPMIIRCEDRLDKDFNELGKNLRKMLKLLKKFDYGREVKEVIRRASYAYRMLMELPVKPELYDIIAGKTGNTFTILDLLDELTSVSRTMYLDDGDMKVLIYETSRVFHRINELLDENNEKMNNILNIVNRQVESGLKTIIVTINATSAMALKKFLSEKFGWEKYGPEGAGLYVTSYKGLKRLVKELHNDGVNPDTVVITGIDWIKLPEIILIPPAKGTIMVLYDEEMRGLKIMLQGVRNRIIQTGRNKKEFLLKAKVFEEDEDFLRELADAVSNILGDKVRKTGLHSDLLAMLSGVATSISEDGLIPLFSVRGGEAVHRSGTHTVEAREIIFTDGSRMFCAADDNLKKIEGVSGAIYSIKVKKLKAGDRVVIIRGNARNSLYDLILEKNEEQPQVDLDTKYIRFWQRSINDAFYRRGLTYEEIHSMLVRLGSRITSSATIGNWIRGDVMGPEDPEDIKRLGIVLGLDELTKSWKMIYRAMKRLRRIHRVVAVQLNRVIIASSSTNLLVEPDDELVEWGLSMADFRDALTVKTIEEISEAIKYVKPGYTGIIFTV
ncbi:hypothetical protein JOC37_000691 [Desulfohalotomaculum tongense]|uniref:DISARM system-associated protein DrmE n=1 Tax=Desulforadius tongensis TaxID=1216062 RepID=UPI00195CABBB|nr:DISARM system-associated protein DrmE [Desulforadius tongensis]MBM7854318.1 hypothetical protein [Desulforadius tongensis]